MVKLYEHPLSPYAQKVKLSMYEKGIEFEAVLPDIFGTDQDFFRVSPRREVPALVDGAAAIFDSTIILEYLEDKWPRPAMLPAAPAERARVRMLEEICDTYYEAINWGMAEIRFFKRATGALETAMMKRAAEQAAGIHSWLERQLGERKWFNGDAFGWGDLSVLPYVNGSAGFGCNPPAGSRLAKWHDAANQRDSAMKCAAAIAPVMAGFEQASTLIESGAMVREYRDHRLEWMIRSGGKQIVLDGMARNNIRFHPELT